ncbi:MAG TPA: hypothetical protein VGD11_12440 [Mycobacteriales bacterium]
MRISDLLYPFFSEVTRVTEVDVAARASAGQYVGLPPEVERRSATLDALATDATLGGTDLVVYSADAGVLSEGDLAPLTTVLAALSEGAKALVVSGDPLGDLAQPRILDALSRNSCQLLRIAHLDYRQIRTGLVIEKVSTPRPMVGSAGGPVLPRDDSTAPSVGHVLRLHNEYAWLDLAAGRARTPAATGSRTAPLGAAHVDAPQTDRERLASLEEEKSRLDQRLQSTEKALADTRGELRRLRNSAKLQIGNALVDVAKRPATAVKLPMTLARIARGKDAPLPKSGPADDAPVAVEPKAKVAARNAETPTSSVPQQRSRLSLGVVSDRDLADRFAADCDVHRILPGPHPIDMISGRRPHILLVHSSAARPGSPWFGVGVPGEVTRSRELLQLLREARRRGTATVLVYDPEDEPSTGFRPFEVEFDLILGEPKRHPGAVPWTPGTRLAGVRRPRPERSTAGLVALSSWSPGWLPDRRLAVQRYVDAAAPIGFSTWIDGRHADPQLPPAAEGSLRGTVDSRDRTLLLGLARAVLLPSVLDGRPESVTDALAAGAVVITDRGRTGLPDTPALLHLSRPEELPAVVERIGAAEGHQLESLRAIREGFTSADALRQLTELLGVDALVGDGDDVSVLASVATESEGQRLLRSVAAQHQRPREIVVAAKDGTEWDWSAEAEALGIPVLTVAADDPSSVPYSRLAVAARSTLVAVAGDADWDPYHLTDLLLDRASTALPPGTEWQVGGIAPRATVMVGRGLEQLLLVPTRDR